ncbi:amidohydrolase family protein [Hufsiella ginkgonis]|uniref:Amidohydrolase family protein n=1 Tax=Hufsiella ginkgonis TaxID=2695274 RepID=A0A7K1XTG4_9SPHI|nr:amidohydrolase family protein [Hufsiella ginkgonis]MXV14128.1 amidohydrolase family protein [Hufsiella ginkgonis]
MKKFISGLAAVLVTTTAAFAQPNIMPALPQGKPVVITGAMIHVGNGQVISNGYIAFDKGKITAIGEGAAPAVTGAEVISAAGKHVYPGFIAPITDLGLVEVESVKATLDESETGNMNPHIRTLIAYNTDSKVIPTLRSNGILLAQPTPNGGVISGQSSVVTMDGWNWEDVAYKTDIAIHLNWPVSRTGRGFGGGGFPGAAAAGADAGDRTQKEIDDLYAYFAAAQGYATIGKPAVTNIRFAAMAGLFNGTKKLFISVNNSKDILKAIAFIKKFGLKGVITGGNEAYLVADELKQNNIPVILEETQTLPNRTEDDVYLPYKMPKMLQDAGVLYSLTGIGFWRQRNLPFEAGTAAAYGLTKEQALSMITLNTAKILGIDKTVGSLEKGKDATLFISKGDALDMITIDVETAFIGGRNVSLDNLHKQLYKRYAEKYNLKQ